MLCTLFLFVTVPQENWNTNNVFVFYFLDGATCFMHIIKHMEAQEFCGTCSPSGRHTQTQTPPLALSANVVGVVGPRGLRLCDASSPRSPAHQRKCWTPTSLAVGIKGIITILCHYTYETIRYTI